MIIRVIRLWKAVTVAFAFLVVAGGLLYFALPNQQEPVMEAMAGQRRAAAVAEMKGDPTLAPRLEGTVKFIQYKKGTMVVARITGLPEYKAGNPPIGPFGFHVHSMGDCTPGNPDNPFEGAGGHYNPDNQPHGNHAGDLPVLFSNHGKAYMAVYTDRFTPKDVIGRSIIIHLNPDDYRSQPSGASGKRIACGVINAAKQ